MKPLQYSNFFKLIPIIAELVYNYSIKPSFSLHLQKKNEMKTKLQTATKGIISLQKRTIVILHDSSMSLIKGGRNATTQDEPTTGETLATVKTSIGSTCG
jgi:hypothetical protein